MPFTRFLPVLALAGALIAPIAAAAQTASPLPATSAAPMAGPHHHHHRRSGLVRALGTLDLSAAQKQQIASFRSQQRQADQNADASTKRANAQKMRTQIMGVLTPDQQTQLRAELRRSRNPSAMNGSSTAPNAMSSPMAMPLPASTP